MWNSHINEISEQMHEVLCKLYELCTFLPVIDGREKIGYIQRNKNIPHAQNRCFKRMNALLVIQTKKAISVLKYKPLCEVISNKCVYLIWTWHNWGEFSPTELIRVDVARIISFNNLILRYFCPPIVDWFLSENCFSGDHWSLALPQFLQARIATETTFFETTTLSVLILFVEQLL